MCTSTTIGGIPMTIRPDPTFHASPKLAMEAPPENFAYTLLLAWRHRSAVGSDRGGVIQNDQNML
jgi:hypothetical protein